MKDQGFEAPGSPPKKKPRIMSLQKCDFCRDRKVRCEPQDRRWPDKCTHCERRGEKCSPPGFATRRQKIRQTSKSSHIAPLSHQSITEASTELPEGGPLGTGQIGVTLPGDIELTYQQMNDIVTVLRCHHTEYRVEISQSQWIERFFRNNEEFGEIEKKQFLEKVANRLRAMSRIQKLTLQHVKSLLQSHKHSSAERMLICQLLVDLETSFSTFTSDSETLYHQQDHFFASDQRRLVSLLCETGDYNGALTLLHRIPLAQIGKSDLKRIMKLGVALCSRMKMIPKILGIGDDPTILDVFEHLDVLVLPYSLLAVHSSQWIDNEAFIKKSFMWPWIRRSVQARLRDRPEAPVDWRPTRLDPQFRDTFGHTFLHAAIHSQDNDHINEIVKKSSGVGQEDVKAPLTTEWPGNDHVKAIMEESLESSQEDVRAYLISEWPSYAPGLTPLACSASSLADWEIFNALLSFSGKNLCCGSDTGTTRHKFCALTIAVRNQEYAVVKALIERSDMQKVDISNCCRWAMSCVPSIPLKIWNRLVEAPRQPVADSDEETETMLGEHEVYSQWVGFSDQLYPTGQGLCDDVFGTAARLLEAWKMRGYLSTAPRTDPAE